MADPVVDDAGGLNENAGLVVVCSCELDLNENTGPFGLDSDGWAEGLKENRVAVAVVDGALAVLGLNWNELAEGGWVGFFTSLDAIFKEGSFFSILL